MNPPSSPQAPNCSRCTHFYVTYDPSHPRGCHAYAFKSSQWPTQVVQESSGSPCTQFEERQVAPDRTRVDGT